MKAKHLFIQALTILQKPKPWGKKIEQNKESWKEKSPRNNLNVHTECMIVNIWGFFLLDNHPVHHVREAKNRIYHSGVLVRFLPPYSPGLNPIEEAFAEVKHFLLTNDIVLQSLADPLPLIWDLFCQITDYT